MELRPDQRITHIRAFVWLIIGLYLSRSVCMSQVAGKIPGGRFPAILGLLFKLRLRMPFAHSYFDDMLKKIGAFEERFA